LFQKALKVKIIKDKKLLSDKEIYHLLQSLENDFSEYSYFWVQYGIAARYTKNFEDAENHLRYALRIRDTYQIQHALAKTQMERGLYELKSNGLSADSTFNIGKEAMRKLLETTSYSYNKALRFSVHSYIDTLLKYSKIKDIPLSEDEVEFISRIIKKIGEDDLDTELKQKIVSFIKYCRENHYEKYSLELNKMISNCKFEIEAISDDYDSDLLDFDY